MTLPETLTYEDYAQDQYAVDVTLEQPAANKSGPTVKAGLSPFDIPESVMVEFPGGDRCMFRFSYPTNEHAESGEREDPAQSGIFYQLGRHTRKILSIRVENAYQRLLPGPMRIDPTIAEAWAVGLPASAQHVCVRNAVVIQRILKDMPDRLRRASLSMLKPAVRR